MAVKGVFLCVLLVLSCSLYGQPDCERPVAIAKMNINQVQTPVLSGNHLWWDDNDEHYIVPKDSGIMSLFFGKLWLVGKDTNNWIRYTEHLYWNDPIHWTGPLQDNGYTDANTCDVFDQIFKVKKSDIFTHQQLANDYIGHSGDSIPIYLIPSSIRNWPAIGNPYFLGSTGQNYHLDRELAQFVDYDGNGLYNPVHGDLPAIRGDECHWSIFNDVGQPKSPQPGFPMGIEVQQMQYAYDKPGVLATSTFLSYKITARAQHLDSVYLMLFVDADLGYWLDDFIGCDTVRNLGICYNGDAIDGFGGAGNYGSNPPFLAIDLLKGPFSLEDTSKSLYLTSFRELSDDFTALGLPFSNDEVFYYATDRWLDGKPLTYGGNGYGGQTPTSFMYPSDPADSLGWSECTAGNQPYDRTFIMVSGPFALEKDVPQEAHFSIVWKRCDPQPWCPTFECIQEAADSVQMFYDALPPLGIEEMRAHEQRYMTIYPNPASSAFIIELNNSETSETQIAIFDVHGKEVFRKKMDPGQDRLELSVEAWSAGIYFIQATGSNGEVRGGKLVVTR